MTAQRQRRIASVERLALDERWYLFREQVLRATDGIRAASVFDDHRPLIEAAVLANAQTPALLEVVRAGKEWQAMIDAEPADNLFGKPQMAAWWSRRNHAEDALRTALAALEPSGS